jgi:hypothetical protein
MSGKKISELPDTSFVAWLRVFKQHDLSFDVAYCTATLYRNWSADPDVIAADAVKNAANVIRLRRLYDEAAP